MSDGRQTDIVDYIERLARPTPPVTTQDRELTRVTSRIGTAIHAFCTARVGKTFTAAELREHVATACGTTAPASADRVLRQLRKQGVVAYRVVNRSASTYLVEGA